jgi:aryl-alcohol dehydrogenase-like predicted oxidoreductase
VRLPVPPLQQSGDPDAVEALQRVAEQDNRTLVSLSLNWLLRHTSTDCVILGATRMDQLEANLRALEEGPLSENALRACDVVWYALRGPAPKYNR